MTASVSIVIPAYNQARYLGKAIESVLTQSFGDIEVIVVNDGSTDETAEVAASYTDPRLRVIHQDNQGLSGARNSGIRQTTAPWVAFLDSDDWLLSDGMGSLMSATGKSQCGTVFGAWERFSSDGVGYGRQVPDPDNAKLPQLLYGNKFLSIANVVQRSWLEQVGLFDEDLAACEDWDLWLRLALAGCRFRCVSDPIAAYRVHDAQMTRQAIRMRETSLAVLRKLSSREPLPREVTQALPEAFAWAYLRAAAREYREGLIQNAAEDVQTAIELHPALRDDHAALVGFFNGWASDPSTVNAIEYLNTVYSNLPSSLTALKRNKSRELGKVVMQEAFQCHQHGNTRAAGALALQAIRLNRSYLSNRGVLSILARAMTRPDVSAS